jgi:hypothetical protein
LESFTLIRGNLIIAGCINLEDLYGLHNITRVDGGCYINANYKLSNLSGLNNLNYVGQELEVGDCSNLKSLEGLDSLEVIKGSLKIYGTDSLIDFTGIENLDTLGGLVLLRNKALANFNGLEISSNVFNLLNVYRNDNLHDFSGLEMINEIGFCKVTSNPHLENFSGLDSVNYMGLLSVDGNPSLSSLSGIDNIDAESMANIFIRNNALLSMCHVRSICDFLASPNGSISIQNNAPGCNSVVEVEDSCGIVTIAENPVMDRISVFPNPFTTSTTIEYELTEPSSVQITIYNAIGETILQADEGTLLPGMHTYTWTPERLSEGLYYAVMRSGDGVSVIKLLKQ